LVSQRAGVINQIRAFLLERGVAVRQRPRFMRIELPRLLTGPSDVVSPRMSRQPTSRTNCSNVNSAVPASSN
jgi:hypothetical protein